MKDKTREILTLLFIICFVGAFFVVPIISYAKKTKKEKHYCPICDAEVEYEVDPELVAEWLETKNDYIVFRDGEDYGDIAWSYFINDSDCLQDFINDYVIEFMQDKGYLVVAPGDKISYYDTSNWE